MNWFYAKDGQPAGPVDEQEFERLIATGAVSDTTLVWRSGLAEWKPYAEIRPAIGPTGSQDPVEASVPTGEPTPAGPQPDAATARDSSQEAVPYAGFWIRVAASLFDALILMPVFTLLWLGFIVAFPGFVAGYPAGTSVRALFWIVGFAIAAGYQTVFVGWFAATPGKMICNLRVIQSDGGRVSYSRALCRYCCWELNWLTFGAAFIIIALNRQKCGLHDFLCDTRVIHTD
jgi:uncharacterized RDD family membrane protein YckC